jgi:hypothetical protein
MTPSHSGRRKDLLQVPKLLEGLKTWLQSMNDASASDVAVPETFEKLSEAPTPVEVSSRLQSGAILGIFTLLVFYFLYFASPILIPIITALLLSMLLALVGIAASLRDPAQSWLTDSQQFSRLEERLSAAPPIRCSSVICPRRMRQQVSRSNTRTSSTK